MGEDGEPTGQDSRRYEFWLYRQIRKRFQAGKFHLNYSLRHRHLSDELVPEGEQAAVLAEMNIPFLQKPVKSQLKALESELQAVESLQPQSVVSSPKAQEKQFYEQLPFCDVTDVFRFVNGQRRFLYTMKPLQLRYAKKNADTDSLMAVIVAQAMNHGNHVMSWHAPAICRSMCWKPRTNSTSAWQRRFFDVESVVL